MVISGHYISANWTLHKRILSFKELPTPQTGVAISNQLMSTEAEWKLINKIVFTTVDNASSNNVAITRFVSLLKDQSTVPPNMQGSFFHVQCSAHIINLVVKDGLKTLSTAISKFVRYTKSTSACKQQFQESIEKTSMKN
jgi:hypothetical protein